MNKSGILLVDKPKGLTSHDVVYKIRKFFNCKTGHAGTLDPIATGVLVVLINEATKISSFLSIEDKEYIVTATLGKKTDTLDANGQILEETEIPTGLNTNILLNYLKMFKGEQMQVPPMFSAVKQGGKKLYEVARKGKTVDRKSRKINIYELELISFNLPTITIRIKCSKGTYVRQFISDLGEEIGCGAFVSELKRISSGKFNISQTYTLEQILQINNFNNLNLISLSDSLDFLPSYICSEEKISKILNGQKIEIDKNFFNTKNTKKIRVLTSTNHLLAIAELKNKYLQPTKVFHEEFINYFDSLPITLNDRSTNNGNVK